MVIAFNSSDVVHVNLRNNNLEDGAEFFLYEWADTGMLSRAAASYAEEKSPYTNDIINSLVNSFRNTEEYYHNEFESCEQLENYYEVWKKDCSITERLQAERKNLIDEYDFIGFLAGAFLNFHRTTGDVQSLTTESLITHHFVNNGIQNLVTSFNFLTENIKTYEDYTNFIDQTIFESRAFLNRKTLVSENNYDNMKKSAKRGAKLLGRFVGGQTTSVFIAGGEVILEGRLFNLRIKKQLGMLSNSHGAVNIEILNKNNEYLTKLCVYFKDTPYTDQFIAFKNYMDHGLENEIIKQGNLVKPSDKILDSNVPALIDKYSKIEPFTNDVLEGLTLKSPIERKRDELITSHPDIISKIHEMYSEETSKTIKAVQEFRKIMNSTVKKVVKKTSKREIKTQYEKVIEIIDTYEPMCSE